MKDSWRGFKRLREIRNFGINNHSTVYSCKEKFLKNGAVAEGRIVIEGVLFEEYRSSDIFMWWLYRSSGKGNFKNVLETQIKYCCQDLA